MDRYTCPPFFNSIIAGCDLRQIKTNELTSSGKSPSVTYLGGHICTLKYAGYKDLTTFAHYTICLFTCKDRLTLDERWQVVIARLDSFHKIMSPRLNITLNIFNKKGDYCCHQCNCESIRFYVLLFKGSCDGNFFIAFLHLWSKNNIIFILQESMYTKLMITEVWWSALSLEGVYDKHKLEEPHVMIISSNSKLVLKPNTSTIPWTR